MTADACPGLPRTPRNRCVKFIHTQRRLKKLATAARQSRAIPSPQHGVNLGAGRDRSKHQLTGLNLFKHGSVSLRRSHPATHTPKLKNPYSPKKSLANFCNTPPASYTSTSSAVSRRQVTVTLSLWPLARLITSVRSASGAGVPSTS